jgi:hypothetical protein
LTPHPTPPYACSTEPSGRYFPPLLVLGWETKPRFCSPLYSYLGCPPSAAVTWSLWGPSMPAEGPSLAWVVSLSVCISVALGSQGPCRPDCDPLGSLGQVNVQPFPLLAKVGGAAWWWPGLWGPGYSLRAGAGGRWRWVFCRPLQRCGSHGADVFEPERSTLEGIRVCPCHELCPLKTCMLKP